MLRVFIRQGLMLTGAGIVLGLAAAAGLTHLMSSLMFDVTALDPLTYAIVPALLLVVSVLAGYLPARRAMVIDPVRARRGEIDSSLYTFAGASSRRARTGSLFKARRAGR